MALFRSKTNYSILTMTVNPVTSEYTYRFQIEIFEILYLRLCIKILIES